jgi:hypothetical protein
MILQAQDHILFYGDSITDAGRNAEQNNNGGSGRRLRRSDRRSVAGALTPNTTCASPIAASAAIAFMTWKHACKTMCCPTSRHWFQF